MKYCSPVVFLLGCMVIMGCNRSNTSSTSTPSTTPYVTWISHENKGLSFSMLIPEEWKIREDDDRFFVCTHPTLPKGNVFVMVSLIDTDFLLKTQTSFIGLATIWRLGWYKSNREIDGVPAVQIDGATRSKNSNRARIVLLKNRGKIYQFIFSGTDPSPWNTYEPIFETMVASFKSS